ncbi:MAG: hypothetical protein PHU95_02555 [Candidatus Thermoplasmatota archaeon]|nr:hypothetical protein [Candidatus Thermoplasmatota archaeon]MDD5778314.1 hypothetical protein [Candidatus Thermoplasmatota archaeon]
MQQDRTSGASEIMRQMREHLSGEPSQLRPVCRDILATYPSMGSLWRLANTVFLEEDAETAFRSLLEADARVIGQGHQVLTEEAVVLTYSRSSTVKEILAGNPEMVSRVLCGEGRPHGEGQRLARELSQAGIHVTLTTDVGLLEEIPEADLVLVGADALVDGAVVNKAGTGAVMRGATAVGLPVYVAATSHKAFPFVFIKEEPGGEVWDSPPPGVRIKNLYFGTASAADVTAFVTEEGRSHDAPVFRGKVAPDIKEIRDHLDGRDGYRLVGGGGAATAKTKH